MTTRKITVGGVPEHFNLPWYFALKDKSFHSEGISCRWRDFPTGTGALCQALEKREIDFAVLLSEGIIKDLATNSPHSKIVQIFVESPLVWGIHVANNSRFKSVSDLKHSTIGISRFGSGSHLMAYVHAEKQQWDTSYLQFKEIGGLQNAITALPSGEADYYLWEKFTTKPLVDNGTFRRIGEIETPWPCFVIAVRNDILEENSQLVQDVLKIINGITRDFKSKPDIDQIIATRHDQKLEDVQSWLEITEWSQRNLNESEIENIQDHLLKLKIISKKLPHDKLIATVSQI